MGLPSGCASCGDSSSSCANSALASCCWFTFTLQTRSEPLAHVRNLKLKGRNTPGSGIREVPGCACGVGITAGDNMIPILLACCVTYLYKKNNKGGGEKKKKKKKKK